jgi:hypothetical protein
MSVCSTSSWPLGILRVPRGLLCLTVPLARFLALGDDLQLAGAGLRFYCHGTPGAVVGACC